MNFLAHLWLADAAGAALAGAILGDYLRGALPAELPGPLATSVRLHRRIDAATDHHPVVAEARRRFGPGARRYAGIVLDLTFDHLLAQDWSRYSAETLEHFSARAAHEVAAARRWFVRAGRPVPEVLAFRSLLVSYRTAVGLEQAVRRTAQRLRQPDGLLEALGGVRAQLPRLNDELPVLLSDLREGAAVFVSGAVR